MPCDSSGESAAAAPWDDAALTGEVSAAATATAAAPEDRLPPSPVPLDPLIVPPSLGDLEHCPWADHPSPPPQLTLRPPSPPQQVFGDITGDRPDTPSRAPIFHGSAPESDLRGTGVGYPPATSVPLPPSPPSAGLPGSGRPFPPGAKVSPRGSGREECHADTPESGGRDTPGVVDAGGEGPLSPPPSAYRSDRTDEDAEDGVRRSETFGLRVRTQNLVEVNHRESASDRPAEDAAEDRESGAEPRETAATGIAIPAGNDRGDCRGIKDDDTDEFTSCTASTPSPLHTTSVAGFAPDDGDCLSTGVAAEDDFDDFTSCVDADDFGDDDGECFGAFTSAVGDGPSSETERPPRTQALLSVPDIDFEKLTAAVLESAFSFGDLPPTRTPCFRAESSDVCVSGSFGEGGKNSTPRSETLGGAENLALWTRLTSTPISEPTTRFEWKSSVLRGLFLDAAGARTERGHFPGESGSPHGREVAPEGKMSPSRRRHAGAGAAGDRATPASPPSLPNVRRTTSARRRTNTAAAIALSASSRARQLDLKHTKRLCGISRDALMKRSVDELAVLQDHYADVLKHALSHLRYWLDRKEQAYMESEMKHNVIGTLVVQAREAVFEKSTAHKGAKRRKAKTMFLTMPSAKTSRPEVSPPISTPR